MHLGNRLYDGMKCKQPLCVLQYEAKHTCDSHDAVSRIEIRMKVRMKVRMKDRTIRASRFVSENKLLNSIL